MNNLILPALLGIVVALIFFIPIIKQKIKLFKDLKTLEAQDKKLKEMTSKQKDDDKYDDFTDGHLYQ
ncbi:hypothetical protein [Lacinutrix sp. Bg11-31]|uniref:hypothetical protein n=1 Tax=Lacinutrix sp. Bg11-31 TaxID=2057808 RepID=UPI000C30F051|nr:hypothetical protein [Lacinutrix sp. Bg11-31]AUC81276.1 hypothetical protein CW733_03645 [Lacinutrix sp. Bg11-31]